METYRLPEIDAARCMGCGLCIPVCPHDALTLEKGKAVVSGDHCMVCGHCRAACPNEAIGIPELENKMQAFFSFSIEDKRPPFADDTVADLVHLMQSRRSCRNYRDKAVSAPVLEDLVKIGITAPSGTNSQKWTFTLLSSRKEVVRLGERIAVFFRKTNRRAENFWLRKGLKLLGKGELDFYRQAYYDSVKKALETYETEGRDLLFHGAPAVIIVGSRPGASCPVEDAHLASQNILLGAHAMGLGTCMIGYAVKAMQADASIPKFLQIPPEETVHSVIALGYPNETFVRFPGRKKCVIRHGAVNDRSSRIEPL